MTGASSRTLRVVVAAGLAGCNGAFGLDPTEVALPTSGIADCDPSHDEDGDGLDDCHDNCAGVPNADQANFFEAENGELPDLVGDICDPDPTRGGDAVAYFFTFDKPEAMCEWQQLDGNWFVEGGQYIGEGIVEYPDFGQAFSLAPVLVPPYTMEARFTVDKLPPSRVAEFGLVANGAAPSEVSCSVKRGFDLVDYVQLYDNADGDRKEARLQNLMMDGEAFRAVFTFAPPGMLSCSIRGEDGSGAILTLDAIDGGGVPAMAGRVGFEGHQMDARIDYVTVYHRP
ncbi:MAG: hypothetical protein M3619_02915 [Myxococcota bacterium]|nr:hypothetical protein [Myxococcota bacterium]